MPYHPTSTTGGGLTGTYQTVPCLRSEALTSDLLIAARTAGSELSFSRWLFAFSLVTTLFFTCQWVAQLHLLSLLHKWLRLSTYRGIRLWCEFVGGLPVVAHISLDADDTPSLVILFRFALLPLSLSKASRRLEFAFSAGVWDKQASEYNAPARLLCAYARILVSFDGVERLFLGSVHRVLADSRDIRTLLFIFLVSGTNSLSDVAILCS